MSGDGRPVTAIGVDLGTSGVRVAPLDAHGDVLGLAEAPYDAKAETRSPAAWWRGVEHCFAQLESRLDLRTAKGIAVDGTSGTMLALDGDFSPIGEALLYNDVCEDRSIIDAIARVAPADSPALGKSSALARAMQLQGREGVAYIVHQADWIAARLAGGVPVSDENNALKTGYDLAARQWPDWIADAGMRIALLPFVYPAGARVRAIAGLGLRLGLPDSAYLHAGTTDGCASFLATGAFRHGDAVTALGSTLVLKIASDRPINSAQHGIYSHRIGDLWLAGGASNTGGAVIDALIGKDRLAELTEKLNPDVSTKLDYYPLLKPGERFPFNDADLMPRLSPRPEDDAVFFQAILEGIATIEEAGYARLQDLGAPRPASVRTVGGGAGNKAWTQIRQRHLGVPFLPVRSGQAAAGAAQLVLRGLQS
jgi:sugar (pentulose or hexulose) kinase